uniref:Cuticle protein 6 n=1 Tax=Timema douglasi TaxID=61478 RepID=A0A7R8VHG8_TIMDO|nr:unnamed protein product [Timema douglasi]
MWVYIRRVVLEMVLNLHSISSEYWITQQRYQHTNMNTLIVLFAMVAAAVARPGLLGYYPYALSSQYHAQDELGQYSYGYAGGLSAKSEVKSFDGVTRGGYSYVDANGELQTVSYTADALNGFRVAATNLPKAPAPIESAPLVAPEPVQDTPEVAAAKAAHLALVSGAAPEAPIPAPLVAPVPVQDTPEVAQARAEHLVAVEKAAAAAAAAPEVPEPLIVSSYSLPAHYAYSVSPGANFAYSSVAPAPWAVAPWNARLVAERDKTRPAAKQYLAVGDHLGGLTQQHTTGRESPHSPSHPSATSLPLSGLREMAVSTLETNDTTLIFTKTRTHRNTNFSNSEVNPETTDMETDHYGNGSFTLVDKLRSKRKCRNTDRTQSKKTITTADNIHTTEHRETNKQRHTLNTDRHQQEREISPNSYCRDPQLQKDHRYSERHGDHNRS